MKRIAPKSNIAVHFIQRTLNQSCRSHLSNKAAAQGHSRKPVNHKFYTGILVTCGACGFLAGAVMGGDIKEAPSPFILRDIEAELVKNFEFNPDLAAGMILLAYNHCMSTNGCPQSSTIHPGNQLCQDIIETLTQVHVIQYSDVLTLAAVAAIRFLSPDLGKVHWRYGRKKRVATKKVEQLTHDSSLSEVLKYHSTLGFSMEETVALMACHGLGRTTSTAYPLQWKERKFVLDTKYFQNLLELNYEQPKYDLQGFSVVKGENSSQLAALPCELEMAHSEETRKILQKFAQDADCWKASFTSAFQKLIELSWDTQSLREYIPLKNEDAIRNYTAARQDDLEKARKPV